MQDDRQKQINRAREDRQDYWDDNYRRGYWHGRYWAVGTAVLWADFYTSDCIVTYTGDIKFYRCGGACYRPYYRGTQITYVVVDAP